MACELEECDRERSSSRRRHVPVGEEEEALSGARVVSLAVADSSSLRTERLELGLAYEIA